jgi:hypothetical protein
MPHATWALEGPGEVHKRPGRQWAIKGEIAILSDMMSS